MTKIFILIFGVQLLSLAAPATISGLVLDPSLKPVPGALIQCDANRATTTPDGRFTMPASGPCEATITAAGFTPATTSLTPGEDNRVQLTIAALNERVVVSATRTFATLEESGVSATVFTRQDISERAYPPLIDLLRDTPGMNVASAGGRGALTGLFTRGAASTGTLVLLDGAPMNDPGGQIDLANLSTAGH